MRSFVLVVCLALCVVSAVDARQIKVLQDGLGVGSVGKPVELPVASNFSSPATACSVNGLSGACITINECQSKSLRTSVPGHCAGPADVQWSAAPRSDGAQQLHLSR